MRLTLATMCALGSVMRALSLSLFHSLTVWMCDRYFLRVKLTRQYASDIKHVVDFAVQNAHPPPEINNSIKMEVGIEDCLHIEFEYNKTKSVNYIYISLSLSLLSIAHVFLFLSLCPVM